MKKSIVEMMKYIDEEALESIEIQEEEINQLTRELDLSKMKNVAKRKMDEEKMKMKKANIKIRNKKWWIVLAATMSIGGTVFATQYLDNFRLFYGEKVSLKTEDTTLINESVVANGIKMTITESIVSDKGAVIMLSFEKEDGTAFAEEVSIPMLEIQGRQDVSYMVNQKLNEEGTKLIANFEIDSYKSLKGEKLEITADKMIGRKTGEVIAEGPWEISFKVRDQKGVKEQAIDLEIKKENEALALNKVNISTLGIAIEGVRIDDQKDKLPNYKPIVKIRTVDGKEMELKLGSANETQDGFRWMYNLDTEYNTVFINDLEIECVIINDEMINIVQ